MISFQLLLIHPIKMVIEHPWRIVSIMLQVWTEGMGQLEKTHLHRLLGLMSVVSYAMYVACGVRWW
jgi:hypothetical protein